MIPTKRYKGRLKNLQCEFEAAVLIQAERAAVEVVEPILKRNNLRLVAGNGAWVLIDTIRDEAVPWDSRWIPAPNQELADLIEFLDMPVPGFSWNTFGSLMPDLPKI